MVRLSVGYGCVKARLRLCKIVAVRGYAAVCYDCVKTRAAPGPGKLEAGNINLTRAASWKGLDRSYKLV